MAVGEGGEVVLEAAVSQVEDQQAATQPQQQQEQHGHHHRCHVSRAARLSAFIGRT